MFRLSVKVKTLATIYTMPLSIDGNDPQPKGLQILPDNRIASGANLNHYVVARLTSTLSSAGNNVFSPVVGWTITTSNGDWQALAPDGTTSYFQLPSNAPSGFYKVCFAYQKASTVSGEDQIFVQVNGTGTSADTYGNRSRFGISNTHLSTSPLVYLTPDDEVYLVSRSVSGSTAIDDAHMSITYAGRAAAPLFFQYACSGGVNYGSGPAAVYNWSLSRSLNATDSPMLHTPDVTNRYFQVPNDGVWLIHVSIRVTNTFWGDMYIQVNSVKYGHNLRDRTRGNMACAVSLTTSDEVYFYVTTSDTINAGNISFRQIA